MVASFIMMMMMMSSLAFEHQPTANTNTKKKTNDENIVDVVGENVVVIDGGANDEAATRRQAETSNQNQQQNTNTKAREASPKAANRLDETILEHSCDSGKTFRTLATLKTAHDVAWSSSDAIDIATLRAAANRSELYVVRLAGRPVNGAGVRICEWWHDVRRAVLTVHADGASGAAFHVDAHVARPVTEVPLSCADAALLPAASAARQPAVRVDFGRAERAPKVAEFRRAVAKQRAEAQDNRPWYIKYWYYIVPAVVLFLISSATGGGAAASAGGEQAAAAPAHQ